MLHWLNLPGEALRAIEGSVPCSRAVLLVPPLLNSFCLQTGLPPVSQLSHFASNLRIWDSNHVRSSSTWSPGRPLTLPSGSCHSALEHGAIWEERLITITTRPGSLLFPLSEDSALPSTPVATPVQEINVAVEAFIYLAAVSPTGAYGKWTFRAGVRRWRWQVLSPATQITAARSCKLIFVFGCWIRYRRKKKADDKTESRQWFKWQQRQSPKHRFRLQRAFRKKNDSALSARGWRLML